MLCSWRLQSAVRRCCRCRPCGSQAVLAACLRRPSPFHRPVGINELPELHGLHDHAREYSSTSTNRSIAKEPQDLDEGRLSSRRSSFQDALDRVAASSGLVTEPDDDGGKISSLSSTSGRQLVRKFGIPLAENSDGERMWSPSSTHSLSFARKFSSGRTSGENEVFSKDKDRRKKLGAVTGRSTKGERDLGKARVSNARRLR